MWGLEYLLLFGLPENKLEVFDGKTRCLFPFLDRATAEAHFQAWAEDLARWRGTANPTVTSNEKCRQADVDGLELALHPLPIELRVPVKLDMLHGLQRPFWRRDFWDGQPAGRETGPDSLWDHNDVVMNLWRFFETVEGQVGGDHCGRVGLVLPEVAAVEPDHYYFRAGRKPRMIKGDYIWDVPDLVAEALSPATRLLDRSTRMEVYARAGIAHLWLLDPLLETLDVYTLKRERYLRVSTVGMGKSYRSPLFPDVPAVVEELFATQRKHHSERSNDDPEPLPDWLVPPETRVGLEYLLLVGHPERRYEVWGDRAPCVLAFGSAEEGALRLRHFVEDASRWESTLYAEPRTLEPELEVADVGRFHFVRRGRQVHLGVAVSLEQYRLMLEAWATREAWDWGEGD